MKFTVPVQSIIGPITTVANICTSNSSNPDDLSQYVLVEVRKDALTLSGTDNTVQISAVVPFADGACESEGTFLMSSDKAANFFKSLGSKDDVSLELDENDELLNIESDRATYSMRVRLMAENVKFPSFKMSEEQNVRQFTVEEHKLRFMLEKSVFCVSREEYRDYLKGVRFEVRGNEFTIFALDGHRMAVLDTQLAEEASEDIAFSMTLRGVTEMQKLLSNSPDRPLTLSVSENFVATKIGMFSIASRILKCKFPNVRGILPSKCSPELPVDLDSLKTYVKRVSLFSNKLMNLINMCFTYNNLDIRSQNADHEIGAARLPINYQDEKGNRDINLNADFVKDFLNAIETPQVVFCFAPPYTNTMLRPNIEINELGIRVRYLVSHISV